MDTRASMIMTMYFFVVLIMVTVILSIDRQTSTDSIEAFIKTEVAKQISEMAIPPVVHGKYVTVIDGAEIIVEEGK